MGDTHYTGPAFDAGDFVTLSDASKAKVTGTGASSVWTAGRRDRHARRPWSCRPRCCRYLPYAVYSFFQNGGRFCWVIRSAPDASTAAGIASDDHRQRCDHRPAEPDVVRDRGPLGRHLGQQPQVRPRDAGHGRPRWRQARRHLRPPGAAAGTPTATTRRSRRSPACRSPATRRVTARRHRPSTTSTPAAATSASPASTRCSRSRRSRRAIGRAGRWRRPRHPRRLRRCAPRRHRIGKVEGPINLNIVGYLNDVTKLDIAAGGERLGQHHAAGVESFTDREDIMVINDSAPPRTAEPGLHRLLDDDPVDARGQPRVTATAPATGRGSSSPTRGVSAPRWSARRVER